MRTAPAALLSLLLGACQTAPAGPIPDPLPEALPWRTSEEIPEGAFLGLKTRENDSGTLDALSFASGIVVTRVVEASPAAHAGFEIGDVVLSFGGRELYAPEDLEALLRDATGDAPLAAQVQRGDSVLEVLVTPLAGGDGPVAEARELYVLDVARTRAAWATGPRGVTLVSTVDEGPMTRARIPIGTTVVALDGEPLTSARGLVRRLETYPPGARVEFRIVDAEGDERERKVRLFDQPTVVTKSVFPILWTYHADPNKDEKLFKLVDLWIFSFYRYSRSGEEKEHRVLHFIKWGSGKGELR
jgi:membrane-associated protease RseP (regulator of RpoE activity)